MERSVKIRNAPKEEKVVSREIKMRKAMVVMDHREIRMQLRQESLRLSFLIAWNQMNRS